MAKEVKEWDWQGINQEINSNILVSINIKDIASLNNTDELITYIYNKALHYYKLKEDVIPSELLRKVEKFIVVESCYSHSGKKKELNFNINNCISI